MAVLRDFKELQFLTSFSKVFQKLIEVLWSDAI